MKLVSWNIDSLNAALTGESTRSSLSKIVLSYLSKMDLDVLALQETKLSSKGPTLKHIQLLNKYFPNYNIVWRSSVEDARKGYAGVMFLYKNHFNVKSTSPKIDAPSTMDNEGRILTLEFDDFFITQVYTPNAGDNLKRLSEREVWDQKYKDYLSFLKSIKPVIAGGDYNVAHKEIDLKNPNSNRFSPGFTDEERSGFDSILNDGFIDTFRLMHGNVKDVYSWWGQRSKTSKINNSGWRIDYWIVSNSLKEYVLKSDMIDSGERQDHAPILLELSF